ncbi:MAG TPA: SDR family oxidoreductase [Acetivibrio sp.]|jgi:nucleoside-diphosphate-sugar epimerase|nr:SDR family oxidoreductase [Clostridium sp.]HOQ36877.1 SDR family oxidoreductase [Acetivibrio sp.]HPT89971.1 SDR family oxidoreductase [Acetivibrio sp.]HQA58244.1 SDR family oxidoreductase [Acetivibrio sp.]
MKVLFIGGTGIISEAASKQAVRQGIDLYLLNRGLNPQFIPEGAKLIKADIRDKESVNKALKGHTFDVVVDWIAFVPEHVKTDIELFRERTAHYIFISSASVYQKPVSHYIVTESTPLANPYWQYSRDKIACEELLMNEYRNTGFPVTIVRPSFTYGLKMIPAALNSWNNPWSIVDRMRKGKKIIVHGDGTSLWTMTHNTDFAKGFIGLMHNSQSIGHAFHITSDEVLNWNQIYKAIGNAAGVEPEIIHIPSDFIARFSPDVTGSLLGDKAASMVFDNTKIKRFVPGFNATVSFSEGIKETIKWFENNPQICTVDEEWDRLMDTIISKYERALE